MHGNADAQAAAVYRRPEMKKLLIGTVIPAIVLGIWFGIAKRDSDRERNKADGQRIAEEIASPVPVPTPAAAPEPRITTRPDNVAPTSEEREREDLARAYNKFFEAADGRVRVGVDGGTLFFIDPDNQCDASILRDFRKAFAKNGIEKFTRMACATGTREMIDLTETARKTSRK